MFAEFQKVTISLVMTVCPSIHMETLGSHWMNFHEVLYLSIIKKSVKTIQVSLKSDDNNPYSIWRPMYIYGSVSLNSS
jgi:putative effector of murein hydrolase